uniref:Uncharacterized protein n=1 Tax=Dulem virus 40 TaxID=3145758 RepID=A0AAU8AUM7_9CAUD
MRRWKRNDNKRQRPGYSEWNNRVFNHFNSGYCPQFRSD